MMLMLSITAAVAMISAALFLVNAILFRRVARPLGSEQIAVSVLVPARNEAERIEATLQRILASRNVELEVLVLDDHSTDETAKIVQRMATQDPRLRLISGASLPPGWCGKQFACLQLAKAARYDEWVFLDADVHLEPEALSRAIAFRRARGLDLLSGFPAQRMETCGEAILIPMMYLVLLTYLPFVLMRWTGMVGASAGCGQWFLTTREAYRVTGGHRLVQASFHDGVKLPRAYRQHGKTTDVFDASDLATCRMYHGLAEVWAGLMKNANEGIANAKLIGPFTLLLTFGYILPIPMGIAALVMTLPAFNLTDSPQPFAWASLALVSGLIPPCLLAARGLCSWRFVLAMPVGVALFVVLQWQAFLRTCRGVTFDWRGRSSTQGQVYG